MKKTEHTAIWKGFLVIYNILFWGLIGVLTLALWIWI